MLMAIKWHPSSKYLASAGGNDRSVRIWHNVTGLKATIIDLTNRLRRANSETIKVLINLSTTTCLFAISNHIIQFENFCIVDRYHMRLS